MTLGATALFGALSSDELGRVESLAVETPITAGTVVVETDDPAHSFYLITDGTAVVSVRGQVAARRGPGEWFGEAALVGDEPRHATVTAETDLVVLKWPASELLEILSRNPEAIQHVFEVVRQRARETQAGPTA